MIKKNPKIELASYTAIMYYSYNMNQNEIAKRLGISRSYVSQLITLARDAGLVTIKINTDRVYKYEVEFAQKHNLKQVYIMDSASSKDTAAGIGSFAAPLITKLINGANVIGVNLGNSVGQVISGLSSGDFADSSDKTVVQIMGGFNSEDTAQKTSLPNELVSRLKNILGCSSLYLNCPAVIENRELRELMLGEPSIKKVMDFWENIDMVIMGIGAFNEQSRTQSLLKEETLKLLEKNKACCDINTHYFNIDGEYLDILEGKNICLSYEQLKKIDKKVVVGYGQRKVKPLSAAIRAGMIDILITDSQTAEAIGQIG